MKNMPKNPYYAPLFYSFKGTDEQVDQLCKAITNRCGQRYPGIEFNTFQDPSASQAHGVAIYKVTMTTFERGKLTSPAIRDITQYIAGVVDTWGLVMGVDFLPAFKPAE